MIYSRTKCPSNSSYAGKNICFGISKSDGFDKPFEFVKQMNTNIEGEDGYFWRDINGYFHMIYHTLSPNKFGSHAYSKNGIDWYLATKNYTLQPAFPFYYTLKNGTKIHVKRRERTQILLDKNGMPSYLFNGVQPDGQPPPGQERFTFTGVQPINNSITTGGPL